MDSLGKFASSKLFIEHGEEIEQSLQRAMRKTLTAYIRDGRPLAVWKDDQMMLIHPEKILGDALTKNQVTWTGNLLKPLSRSLEEMYLVEKFLAGVKTYNEAEQKRIGTPVKSEVETDDKPAN